MPVFKTFLKIARKNLPSAIMYLVIFMSVGMVVSNVNLNNKEFETSSFTIGIEDNDNSEISKALAGYLGKNHTIVDIPNTKDELIDQMYFREINYTITIPTGFEESILNNGELALTLEDIEESSASYYINSQIQQYLNSISAYIIGGNQLTEAITSTDVALEESMQVEMVSQNNGYDKSYFYFQFMAYVMICINFSVIAPVIIVFNNKDIHSRNECSIMSTVKQRMQIILGSIVVSLLVWGISLFTSIIAGGIS